MKTIKIILAIILLVFIVSCKSKTSYYKMVSIFDRKGNVHRELYAFGDSAFMAGNISNNPFLFELDSDWHIHRFDTIIRYNFFGNEEKLNVKIIKDATSIENYAKDIRCDEKNRSLTVPEESLIKKSGWFYTNYSFQAVYKKFQYNLPVPIDDYLNKEEQILWTQGNMDDYKIMNGMEMNDYLSEIAEKFWKWHGCNRFEISLEIIKKQVQNYDLDSDKEKIYKQAIAFVDKESIAIDPKTLSEVLDSFYKTNYFSKQYNTYKEIWDEDFQTTFAIEEILMNVISYELVLPDKTVQTNAPIISSDTLTWKIDGMRLLFDDYTLTAEYRVMNRWAFGISGLLVLVAVGSGVLVVRRKNRR